MTVTEPPYPPEAKTATEQGTVGLRFFCDEQGQLSDITLARSSGYRRLDNALLDTAKAGVWRCYQQASFDARATAKAYRAYIYTFRLFPVPPPPKVVQPDTPPPRPDIPFFEGSAAIVPPGPPVFIDLKSSSFTGLTQDEKPPSPQGPPRP